MITQEKSLEDVLIELQLLSREQWLSIQRESREKNTTPEKLLVEKKILSSEVITKAKAIALKVPFVDLKKIQIPDDTQNIIPLQVAQRYRMIIFFKKDDLVKVAMVDPTDFQALDYVRGRTNCRIEPHIAAPEDVEYLIGTQSRFDTTIGAALDSVQENDAEDIFKLTKEISLSNAAGKMQADSTPVVQMVNNVFDFAIKKGASDIHIEGEDNEARVRCRIDGILQEITRFPLSVHPAVISRVKIMSNMKIDEKRIPQDGRISLKTGTKEYDLRVSTLPTIHGEKIVIRLLTKTEKIPTLEELGFRGRALHLTMKYFQRTNGMFLSTGPTGSGKSTTLYSALKYVNTPEVNTVTLEDPVEHIISGVNQVQINAVAGLTFGSGLRSIVRQDPNIIMVGEIRDMETADLAINASLTGHLVFSTLHTNNAASGITRLIDIGIEPFLVASTVNIIVAQRLVRKICSDCREKIPASTTVVEQMQKYIPFMFRNTQEREFLLAAYPNIISSSDANTVMIYHGKGCNMCRGTGYHGRMGIYEVMEITDKIRDLAIKKSSENEIQYQAITEGMLTLLQEGMLKVLDGQTSIEEVLRVAA
ncbi:MAG: GspE/PulE family protein [bacterium]